ncbi:hypothetical protein C2G38_2146533 [Gigaspora rosea]|uniref:Uncharacterized protein n=1 Tax=Gigaspora rosea TaxID=44941 RepID=A0A397UGR5_9GLOM|nr:hypothetical protein C2G38_2146533 [Gigaspora rosea]
MYNTMVEHLLNTCSTLAVMKEVCVSHLRAKRASVSDICTAASDDRASVCCPTRQRSGFNTGQCSVTQEMTTCAYLNGARRKRKLGWRKICSLPNFGKDLKFIGLLYNKTHTAFFVGPILKLRYYDPNLRKFDALMKFVRFADVQVWFIESEVYNK